MGASENTFPSRYTLVDEYWPLQIETNSSGRPLKLLLKDPWYHLGEQVYDVAKKCATIAGSFDFSTDFINQLELPKLPIEIESLGVTVFVFRLVVQAVIWAAKRGLELSKFELHYGGFGVSGIGWTPAGHVLYREC